MTVEQYKAAFRELPLPALMVKLGLAQYAEKSARCPFRPNEHLSFSVSQSSAGKWRWKCDSGCGHGNEIDFLIKLYGVKVQEAAERYVEIAGVGNGGANAKQALTGTSQVCNGTINGHVAEKLSAASETRTLAETLDSICAFLRRYVVFQFPEQPILVALWIAHTWVLEAFDYTPYLHVHSVEKRSGKTRLLDVVQLLARRAWRAVSPSVSVLFRRVERDKPTLLYDEVDNVFHDAKNNGTEEIRSLLNTGFERGATISRCVGKNANLEIKDFDPFCAKALSGIGKVLPDTVADRCVAIELVRQSRDARGERLRKRDAQVLAASMRAELEAFSQQTGLIDALRSARPTLPDELSDRQQDICEPLLAIAEMAGDNWPQNARAALVKVGTQEEDASARVKLLVDIKRIFDARGADRLTTEEILEALVRIEDSPWAIWWADDLKFGNVPKAASKLARMLKEYKRPDGERLKPRTVRIG